MTNSELLGQVVGIDVCDEACSVFLALDIQGSCTANWNYNPSFYRKGKGDPQTDHMFQII